MNIIKITKDFETQSPVDLKKAGAYEYSMHPETKVMCFAFKKYNDKQCFLLNYYLMQMPWRTLPDDFKKLWLKWAQDPNTIFEAHNAYFEQCIYNNILVKRLEWPAIAPNKFRCSAARAAAVAIPRNLQDAGAVMETSIQKDFEGHRVMMKLCKPTGAWSKWKKKLDSLIIKDHLKNHDEIVSELTSYEPEKYYTPATAPEDFKKLYKYCRIDVLAEEELSEKIPDLNDTEQVIWFLDQIINFRGVAVDMPLVNRISEIMKAEAKVMNKELDILTMGLVSSGNARNAILDFLTIEGLELPDLRAATVDDFLENGKATGDAAKILKIRKALAKSSTAKYTMFKMRAASDGRVRDLYMYSGAARTGRWSGKGLQAHNFPRGVIKDIYEAIERIKTEDVETLKLLYGENLMPLFSSVLRGMFIASKGHELFVEDWSAIECRVTWWLANHKVGLQMFANGEDPYWEEAKNIFKLPKSLKYDANNSQHAEWRQVGKAAVLGCGFGMGGKKFVTSAWDVYRAKCDLDMAKIAVSTYRERHYPVVEMWEQYQDACIFAVENPKKIYRVGRVKFFKSKRWLFIQLPSGRRLAYCDPKVKMAKTVVMEKMVDGQSDRVYANSLLMYKKYYKDGYRKQSHFFSKRLTYFEVNLKAKKEECRIPKWSLENTYGGKIVENVVQAVSRDLLAAAIVRAEGAGLKVVMHSHDELVCEAPKGKFKSEQVNKIMTVLPAWAEGLPIKSGGWVNTRYRKG